MDTKSWCLISSLYARSFVVRLGSISLLAIFRKITYSAFILHCGVLRSFPSKVRLLIRAISNAKTCLVFDEVASLGWPDGTCSKNERPNVTESTSCRHPTLTNVVEGFVDAGMSSWAEQRVVALFMYLSWCQTCDVATSRCRMFLSSFGCLGENALHYKEWIVKCSAEKQRKKSTTLRMMWLQH